MSKKSSSNNKAQSACQLHPGNSDHLNYCKSLYGPQTKPLCPDCVTSVFNSERFKPQFKVYSTQEIYSITFSSFPDDPVPAKNVPIDLLNNRLESIIVDNQSSGYDANSLVYLPDKQLLASCSINGRVLFWSIGDVIDCVGELNFKGSITFAKYVNLEDKQYLLIVAENEVHIYDITKKIVLKKVVETSSGIQCIETDVKNKRLIAVSGGSEVTIWNLETFKTIKTFKVEAGSKSSPILSVLSIEKGNSLILHDQSGLRKVSLGDSDLGKVEKGMAVTGKKKFLGVSYLAKAKKILVRVEGEGLLVVNEKDLSTDSKYQVKQEAVASQITATEKESQILETTRLNNFVVYHDKSKVTAFPITSLITKSCAVAILEDQYRFVIADALSGTLLVYRTNDNEGAETKSSKKSPAKASPKGKKNSPLKASRVISGQRTLFRKHHPVVLAIQERKAAKSKLKLKSTGAKSRLALAKSSVDKSGSSKKKKNTKEDVESDSSSEEENVVVKKSSGKPIMETFKESVEKVGIHGETGERVKSEKVYVVFEERKTRSGSKKKDEKEEKKGRGRSKKGEKEEKKGRGRSQSKSKKDEKEEKKGRGRSKKNDEDSRERSRSKSKSVARTKTSKKVTKKSK